MTDNFRPNPAPVFTIPRIELNLQLNTAPLLPAVTEKPAVIVIPSESNVTRNNNTNSNDTRILQKNVVRDGHGRGWGEEIGHFTIVCLVTWPWVGSEVGGDLVLIQTCDSIDDDDDDNFLKVSSPLAWGNTHTDQGTQLKTNS